MTAPVEPIGYEPSAVESRWRQRWAERGTHQADLTHGARPFYALMMFPYPSAEGLHVGNLFAFTGSDIYGRFQRLQGHTVLRADRVRRVRHPLGELRAEGGRAPDGTDPAQHRQLPPPARPRGADGRLDALGRHHRARLLQVDAVGLPAALKRGLAVQEEGGGELVPVAARRCWPTSRWRAASASAAAPPVEQRVLEQWFFRITRLRRAAARQPRRRSTGPRPRAQAQRNWIGRCEGAELRFRVLDPRAAPAAPP